MNPRRVWLIAGEGIEEALHLRLAWLLAAAGVGLAAGGAALTEFNFGLEEPRFLTDVASAVQEFFGSLQAVLLTVALVHGGIEHGRPQLLFVRGVRRPEWLLGSLAAVAAGSLALVLTVQLVLGALLAERGAPPVFGALADAGARAWLRLGLVGGFALVTSVICQSGTLAAALACVLTAAAHLAPAARLALAQGGSLHRPWWMWLTGIVPDFSVIDGVPSLVRATAYAGACSALQVTAACLIFSRRDL